MVKNRPEKNTKIATETDKQGQETSIEQFNVKLVLAMRSWRANPNDGAAGLWAVQLHSMMHRKMPNDLQDWLADCIELSRGSMGEISLDKAFGIKDPAAKQNAFNQSKAIANQSECIAVMEFLIEVCGITEKKFAAKLVVQRECPDFGIETLTKYYRAYDRESGEKGKLRDWFRSNIRSDYAADGESKINVLQSFLNTGDNEDKLALKKRMAEIQRDTPL